MSKLKNPNMRPTEQIPGRCYGLHRCGYGIQQEHPREKHWSNQLWRVKRPHVDVDEGREVAKPLLNEDVGAALLGEHRGKLCPAQRPRQGDQAAHLSWRDMT